MKNRYLFITSFILLLQGCGSFFTPVGENKFDCNRRQGGNSEFCRSFKAMNKSTDAPLPESRFDKELSMKDFDKATGIAPDAVTANNTNSTNAGRTDKESTKMAANQNKSQLLIHERKNETVIGRPIRVAPVVQRTWIKPFVSGQDMHGAVLVYREIIPSRWLGFEESEKSKIKNGLSVGYPHFAPPVAQGDKTPPAPTQAIKKEFSSPVKTAQNPSMSAQPSLGQSLTQPLDGIGPGVSLDSEADSKPR